MGLALTLLFQFLKGFNKIKIGDTLTDEFVNRASKKLRITVIFIVTGGLLGITGVLLIV
jgi:hypothetical protein